MYADHTYVCQELQNTDIGASEFHGLLCGLFCQGVEIDTQEWQHLISPYLPEIQTLDNLSAGVWSHIEAGFNNAELGLNLLLPDEDAPMELRAKNLACWCSGFISGFGLGETLNQNEKSAEVMEVLQDLESIARVNERVDDSEENEADFMELEEYARMAAIMIYMELDNL